MCLSKQFKIVYESSFEQELAFSSRFVGTSQKQVFSSYFDFFRPCAWWSFDGNGSRSSELSSRQSSLVLSQALRFRLFTARLWRGLDVCKLCRLCFIFMLWYVFLIWSFKFKLFFFLRLPSISNNMAFAFNTVLIIIHKHPSTKSEFHSLFYFCKSCLSYAGDCKAAITINYSIAFFSVFALRVTKAHLNEKAKVITTKVEFQAVRR